MSFELDPRFTFEAFVVGPANRLAVAAARRVADAPASTYNPLVLYSASGLGKTHLLTSIGHRTDQLHDIAVVFETVEHLMKEIAAAVETGAGDAFRDRLLDADMLLLDDIQFVTGQRQFQEELIRVWDDLITGGAQVVLTSDRPPQEIDGLDERLLTRLSGGLIVDISAPDYETRVAIARRKSEERGRPLSPDVCQAVGRLAFSNVRELQGALNRLIAVEELEERTVRPDEVVELLGAAADRGADEFGAFLSDITGTVTAGSEAAGRLVDDAIRAWAGEGFRTRRLEAARAGLLSAGDGRALVRRFEHDAARLRHIEAEIRSLEPDAPELASDALRDPDRIPEAEVLMAAVRGRLAPPPRPPEGPGLDELDPGSLAHRAARAVAEAPGQAYNPLYIMGPEGAGKTTLLAALGNALRQTRGLTVGYHTAETFSRELIEALEHSRLDAWRARIRVADALLLDDLEGLAGTERAQEELFHIFEELQRSGRQLVFAAATAPHDLAVSERLQSRLGGGLVVELGIEASDEPFPGDGTLEIDLELELTDDAIPPKKPPQPVGFEIDLDDSADEAETAGEPEAATARGGGGAPGLGEEQRGEHWIQSREKVLWEWPYPVDWIQESLD